MTTISTKRIIKELTEITKNPVDNITASPVNTDNMYKWTATINGPSETPYSGGIFVLSIVFPEDYPFSPPCVKFVTKIYHCNVNNEGSICLDILKENWSPSLSIEKILLSICSLMADPNPDDPLDSHIAYLYKTDRAKHDAKASEWTVNFAK